MTVCLDCAQHKFKSLSVPSLQSVIGVKSQFKTVLVLFSEVWRSVLPRLPVGFIRTACWTDKWLRKPPPQRAFLKMAIWHSFSRQAMIDQLCRGETGGRVWTSPALIIHLLHNYFWHFLCEQRIATLEMSSKKDWKSVPVSPYFSPLETLLTLQCRSWEQL